MKKLVALVLTVIMTATVGAGNIEVQAGNFKDVKSSDWYYSTVTWTDSVGLMTGMNSTYFGARENLSRAQLAVVLHRLTNKEVKTSNKKFPDVDYASSSWYGAAVTWATSFGVVAGYDNGRFGTNDSITREQLATMLYRYAKAKGYDMSKVANLGSFPDASRTSSFAKSAMQWAVGAGIIQGMSNGKLSPQGSASRGEVATMVYRFVAYYNIKQETVNHAEQGHYEIGVIKEAWNETVYDSEQFANPSSIAYCFCGEYFISYRDGKGIEAYNKHLSEVDRELYPYHNYTVYSYIVDVNGNFVTHSVNAFGKYPVTVQVHSDGINMWVKHPAEMGQVWVVDKAAWTEKVWVDK